MNTNAPILRKTAIRTLTLATKTPQQRALTNRNHSLVVARQA